MNNLGLLETVTLITTGIVILGIIFEIGEVALDRYLKDVYYPNKRAERKQREIQKRAS